VIYLQEVLDGWLGAGRSRVILPITDPYVVHHGALGSFATVYLPDGIEPARSRLASPGCDGIELVLPNEAACAPLRAAARPDRRRRRRLDAATVLGTSPARHDLSGLDEPLRSHGGISEQTVPLLLNRPIADPRPRELRNFDVFDLALNHAVQPAVMTRRLRLMSRIRREAMRIAGQSVG
jgi:phosphonoacetate hydrolase